VLYTLAEGVRVASVLALAFTPDAAARVLTALGQDDGSLENARLGALPGGARVEKIPPLFPRVESSHDEAA
jgi:methionyl-tRNA synthetase